MHMLAHVAVRDDRSHAPDVWAFKVGQCVTHATQVMPSIVTSAVRTSNGLGVYTTESYLVDDTVPGRVMLGTALRPVTLGSAVCEECLLWKSQGCPMAAAA